MKKRSAASWKSKPLDRQVLFIDRSLGKRIVPGILRAAGASVQIHDDHFRPDAPDEEWLRVVGERGWLVLTKDRRIRYRATAVAAVASAGVRLFVLTAGDVQGSEMGRIFSRALPRIDRFVVSHPAPFIAAVTRTGALRMLATARELSRR